VTRAWRSFRDRLLGRDRVAWLRQAGRTIEMNAVEDGARVVEIDIGFGRELWSVAEGDLVYAPGPSIENGKLVVTGHRRATPTSFRRATGRRPEHIPTRI
jgi:hypothetical protein